MSCPSGAQVTGTAPSAMASSRNGRHVVVVEGAVAPVALIPGPAQPEALGQRMELLLVVAHMCDQTPSTGPTVARWRQSST